MRVVLLLVLAGCSVLSEERAQGRYDQDGDGVAWPDDCDDSDALVSVESTSWADADEDTYGDPASETTACHPPSGSVLRADDCDDTRADVSPDGIEVCDGQDNDCDGVPDDDPTDATLYYEDQDGDTYGADETATATCEDPGDPWVSVGGDCDDLDDTAFPGAPVACSEDDQNCDGKKDDADGDGDGFAGCEECDDTDVTIFPGANESCNDLDDDCDGFTDEDPVDGVIYFLDLDGDGYGSHAGTLEACEPPAGYADNADDCDDSRKSVNPAASESCDKIDNDCDLEIDEADAIDATVWYFDGDDDGYGNPKKPEPACSQPLDHVSNDADCDDGDALFNPSATETCTDTVDWNCDGSVGYTDTDKDGFAACEECNDGDSTIFPGADERCDTLDNDCDGLLDEDDAVDASTWYRDADLDTYGDAATTTTACARPAGYAADDTDCDDTDDAVSPAQVELCDGIDNNCGAGIDEATAADASDWYADDDGDGYGNAGDAATACSPPSGYLDDDTDCDDSVAAIHPGADEYCDGIDNDCNAVTDESTSLDASTWYRDADGDGHGDALTTSVSCDEPAGYVDTADDCDDTDALSYAGDTWYVDDDGDGYGDPSKPVAVCGGSTAGLVENDQDCDDADALVMPGGSELCDAADMDEDCDGLADDLDSGAEFQVPFYEDADGDGYGDPDALGWACDDLSGYVRDNGDCNDGNAAVNPGAGDCAFAGGTVDLATDYSARVLGVTTLDAAGTSVAFAGDVDGDGRDDVLVGGPSVDDGAPGAGAAYVVLSPVVGSVSLSTAVALLGSGSGDAAGTSVSGAGDVDDDHYGDLLVGASSSDEGATDGGAAYLVMGPVSADLSLAAADATFLGETASDGTGTWVGSGDFDGDATPDVAIGSPLHGLGGTIYLWLGSVSGSVSASTADGEISGETGAGVGKRAALGDLDGDGIDDLVAGAAADDSSGSNAGAAYLALGPLTGALDLGSAWGKLLGESGGDEAGTAVASGQDIDGDGNDDVLVTATKDDDGATNAGALYLWLGPTAGGDRSLAGAQAKLVGEGTNDNVGTAVAMAGDVDGDGTPDLLVSGSGLDMGGTNAGGAYLLLGTLTGTIDLSLADAVLVGDSNNDFVGTSLAGGGSVDGVGRADFLLGASGVDGGAVDAGAAYLVRGEDL